MKQKGLIVMCNLIIFILKFYSSLCVSSSNQTLTSKLDLITNIIQNDQNKYIPGGSSTQYNAQKGFNPIS